MHITDSSSAYMENVWLWTADHDIDDPDWQDNNNTLVSISILVAGSLLAHVLTYINRFKLRSTPREDCLLKVQRQHGFMGRLLSMRSITSTISTRLKMFSRA